MQNSSDPNPKKLPISFYIAHHDAKTLRECKPPSHSWLLHLPSLDLPRHFLDNRFAESRALLWMAMNPEQAIPHAGYLGLFHASYDQKFGDVLPKLAELRDEFEHILQPDIVVCPILTKDIFGQANSCHPMMHLALERILKRVGVAPRFVNAGPLTNSFIAHVDVWKAFLPTWLRWFIAAQDECDIICFDTLMCKKGVEAAYICERLTTMWFAMQSSLRMGRMLNMENEGYEPLMRATPAYGTMAFPA